MILTVRSIKRLNIKQNNYIILGDELYKKFVGGVFLLWDRGIYCNGKNS